MYRTLLMLVFLICGVQVNAQQSILINTYVPAAATSAGYQSFLRVINTGNVATPITVSRIDGLTGVAGTASPLIGSLPAGAAMTITAQQVEAAMGIQMAAVDRPTMLISTTAATTIEAQSYLLQPGGVFNEVSAAQSGLVLTLPTYLPAASAPTGYQSYLRVINTGTFATQVTVALIDQTTGVTGTPATLIASLPAGAAQTFSASQVESALGILLTAAQRPQIVVSGTNATLSAQSFLTQPGGAFTNISSSQSGSTVDVRTYVPAAAVGYTSYIRVTNNSATAAPITAAIIDGPTGSVGAIATLVSSLPAHAAMTLSSAQVEAALGTSLPSASRPRIRISSSAGNLTVQSFLLQPGGQFYEVSGVQTGTSVAIRTYIPAADLASGYTSYLRVINTGATATPITVALIDGRTGSTGTASTLLASLPAGAAQSFSPSQFEAALGKPIAAGTRPRIQIAGNGSNVLEIQSFLIQPSGAFAEVSGALPSTENPAFSIAGTWLPVIASDISSNYTGGLANTFHAILPIGAAGQYGLVVTGWGFSGWPPTLAMPAHVSVNILSPDSTGNLSINTSAYISDPVTNGGGSLIVADFNGDGKPDIFLAAHNESPFVAMPSTAYLSNASGGFTKVVLSDHSVAHDAELVYINGKPNIVTVTYSPGDYQPSYSYTNGNFIENLTSNLSSGFGGGGVAVANFGPQGQLEIVRSDACSNYNNSTGYCTNPSNILVTTMNGSVSTIQSLTPYLSTLPQYKNTVSYMGPGITHTSRVWVEDLNHDGKPDLIAAQSMWSQTNKNFPSALQVLINKGDGTFIDRTETLNPEMGFNMAEIGYTPTFIDLDHSGINTYLFSGSTSWGDPSRQSDHVLLNDGTGRLYIALHNNFFALSPKVFSFLNMQFNSTSTPPRFIAIPQSDGSLNFLAEVGTRVQNLNGILQSAYKYVNVPLHYNPTTAFTQDVVVSDRNGSMLMRTWAGNDTFYDTNAAQTAHIDGGLGSNKCVYSGKFSDYQITKNADGSYTVLTSGSTASPKLTDTLVRIQTLRFSDKVVTLN